MQKLGDSYIVFGFVFFGGMMKRLSLLGILAGIMLCMPDVVGAIVVDDFQDNPSLPSVVAQNAEAFKAKSFSTQHAIGGSRKIFVEKKTGTSVQAEQSFEYDPVTNTPANLDSRGVFGFSSNTNNSSGTVRLIWDAELIDQGTVKHNGLRGYNGASGVGVDLTEDGADRFLLKNLTRDLPVNLILKVYDASSPTKVCITSFSLSQAPIGQNTATESLKELVFQTDFTAPIGNSCIPSELFTNVGAIELIIEGSQLLDFSMDSISTNGVCPALIPSQGPNSGSYILDLCGVCGGNNSKCKDCQGNVSSVPGFVETGGGSCSVVPALPPNLGECSAGTYVVGTPSTGTTPPICSCNPIKTPIPEICDGLDNDCDGSVDEGLFDACGVCGGNGSSCAGCDGVPNSGKVFDVCNVCGGNGTSCLGCDGIPNSGKVPDVCNVCGGDGKSCLGCDGVPNSGKVLDACNICGGDGKSCAGCDGVSGSGLKTDICGVCGGDGKSCTSECDKTDIRDKIFDLDLQAKEAEKVIVRGTRVLFRNPKARSLIPNLKKLLVDAHNLQVTNWILSWTLPEIITSCKNDIVCFKSSNVSKLDTYRVNANALLKLNDQAASMLRRVGLGGRARIMERNGRAVLDHALGLAATIPETTTVCNIESSLP